MTYYDDAMLQSTADLISSEGESVNLMRGVAPTPDGVGGWVLSSTTSTDIGEQQFFISTIPGDANENFTDEGETTVMGFVVIGMPEDDIAEGDWFMRGEQKYVVRLLHPNRMYQLKGIGAVTTSGD